MSGTTYSIFIMLMSEAIADEYDACGCNRIDAHK